MKGIYFSERIILSEIERILISWKNVWPDLGVLAFLPELEKDQVPGIQKIFCDLKIPLMGAVFPALVSNDQFYSNGLILLVFPKKPFWQIYPVFSNEPEKMSDIIDELSIAAKSHIGKDVETTLFLIFDAMIRNISTILDHIYLNLADRVHYMGVNAGSESFNPIPCLFDQKNILQDAVLLIIMDNHNGAILEHGYNVPSKLTSATATSGNRIISIDWHPAFEVYKDLTRINFNVIINKDNFYQYGVHFPFGILRANGEIVVRIPVALEDDGSLFCVGEVPANSVLTLLNAPKVDINQTVKTLVDGLAGLQGSTAGKDLLTFYCAGRRLHIGDMASQELRLLGKETGANMLIGALSLGEIGSSIQGGYPLFHNATMVCSFWEPK